MHCSKSIFNLGPSHTSCENLFEGSIKLLIKLYHTKYAICTAIHYKCWELMKLYSQCMSSYWIILTIHVFILDYTHNTCLHTGLYSQYMSSYWIILTIHVFILDYTHNTCLHTGLYSQYMSSYWIILTIHVFIPDYTHNTCLHTGRPHEPLGWEAPELGFLCSNSQRRTTTRRPSPGNGPSVSAIIWYSIQFNSNFFNSILYFPLYNTIHILYYIIKI